MSIFNKIGSSADTTGPACQLYWQSSIQTHTALSVVHRHRTVTIRNLHKRQLRLHSSYAYNIVQRAITVLCAVADTYILKHNTVTVLLKVCRTVQNTGPTQEITFSWMSVSSSSIVVLRSRPYWKAQVTWNDVLHALTEHWMHAPTRSRHREHSNAQRLDYTHTDHKLTGLPAM